MKIITIVFRLSSKRSMYLFTFFIEKKFNKKKDFRLMFKRKITREKRRQARLTVTYVRAYNADR